MTELMRHGAAVKAVFDLLGVNENDLTAVLGFALSRSSTLLAAVVRRVWPTVSDGDLAEAALALEVRGEAGRTDLELTLPGALLIIEAKRDWLLPTTRQLAAYAPRVHKRGSGALITLSQASNALARAQLPTAVDGVPVVHLSWRDIVTDVGAVSHQCRGQERLWLDELANYLQGVVRLRSIADSWTYCVVLNTERPGGGGAHTSSNLSPTNAFTSTPTVSADGRPSRRTSSRLGGGERFTASIA